MWGLILLIGGIKYQTDWMGGAGIQGPVTLWGTKYYTGDSITIATPGQVSLKATHWNYGNWTRHIVEQNSDIPCHVQGTMPADIDKDGITDLVAHTGQEVVWYKHDGLYNFSKRIIGPASRNGICSPCVYPCDLDQDGDIDVLVATDGVGLGWYENIGTQENWPWHLINNAYGYHRVSSADIELDGDLDIIAVNNWPQTPVNTRYYKGDIYIFRNNGDGTFATPTMIDLPLYEGWRVYTADFNKDGYPDIYTSLYTVYVFMNDGAGNFTQSFHGDYWGTGADFDGCWPSDINMDGNLDLVAAGYVTSPDSGYYAFLGNGAGGFTLQSLPGTATNTFYYTDGAITADIDLDGGPDIAGAMVKVAWFRQSSPMSFNIWVFDQGPYDIHWVYLTPMCKCAPRIDMICSGGDSPSGPGYHMVFENRMYDSLAKIGQLTSSIIRVEVDTMKACSLLYFGYKACVPNDTSIGFYWRSGYYLADINSRPWNGPYPAELGINVVDSFALSGYAHLFQYKAEFKNGPDIGVLYEVWFTYTCPGVGVEELPTNTSNLLLHFKDGKIVLSMAQEDNIELVIYDVAGRVEKKVYNGYLASGEYKFEVPQKSGIYFAKISSSKSGTQKLKFIKIR